MFFKGPKNDTHHNFTSIDIDKPTTNQLIYEMQLNFTLIDYLRNHHAVSTISAVVSKHLGCSIGADLVKSPRSVLSSAILMAGLFDGKSRLAKRLLAEASSALQSHSVQTVKDSMTLIKNAIAVKKCKLAIEKLLKPTHCKICKEVVDTELLANHSFICFEREVVHEEVIKINKMIIKLSTGIANLKTKLGKLCS